MRSRGLMQDPTAGLSRRELRALARRLPKRLTAMPRDEWPQVYRRMNPQPAGAWASQRFIALLFPIEEDAAVIARLSIRRSDGAGGITWDEIQRIKAACGLGEVWAVEAFPPDADLVAVANMRHLWILAEPPAWGWRGGS